MSSTRALTVARRLLDGRRLVWVGIRGEDAESLVELDELQASFSVIARMRVGTLGDDENVSLEELRGIRHDLDAYDLDLDADEDGALSEWRSKLLRAVSEPSVVLTYRPSGLISAMGFAMDQWVTHAGMFKDRQSAFEHKPWVEHSLTQRGVRGLGWTYIADEHQQVASRMIARGPHVLRASRTSGGVGIAVVSNDDELRERWPVQDDQFVAVAPFLDPTTPVNFTGVVFDDGTVHLHPPSVQLIGIPGATARRFGYCGNDFAAVKRLAPAALEELDAMGQTVGAWLHAERYQGVFGIDALVDDDGAHFTEINARFQGSSSASARIAGELGVADVFVEHLTAMLGATPDWEGLTLPEWVASQPDRAQIVVHNTAATAVRRRPGALKMSTEPCELAQDAGQVPVAPDATLGRLTVDRAVTTDGFAVDDTAAALIYGHATNYQSV